MFAAVHTRQVSRVETFDEINTTDASFAKNTTLSECNKGRILSTWGEGFAASPTGQEWNGFKLIGYGVGCMDANDNYPLSYTNVKPGARNDDQWCKALCASRDTCVAIYYVATRGDCRLYGNDMQSKNAPKGWKFIAPSQQPYTAAAIVKVDTRLHPIRGTCMAKLTKGRFWASPLQPPPHPVPPAIGDTTCQRPLSSKAAYSGVLVCCMVTRAGPGVGSTSVLLHACAAVRTRRHVHV